MRIVFLSETKNKEIKTMVTLEQALDMIDSSEIFYNNSHHSFKEYPSNRMYIASRIKGLKKQFPDNQDIRLRVTALEIKLGLSWDENGNAIFSDGYSRY